MLQEIPAVKLCARHDQRSQEHRLWVQDSRLFHQDTTQYEEIEDLLRTVVEAADNIEQRLWWEDEDPEVDTTDGLWWVEHADPDNPVPSDFVETAPVAGTAIAADPEDPDLDFDVAGVPYTEPPEGPP